MKLLPATFEPWGTSSWYPSQPPTAASLKKIRALLGIDIPELFVEMASTCTSYGGWFGSIGEDYDSHNHMITINRIFHSNGISHRYVLMNHGHDGDIDAWDTGISEEQREHPIVYICQEDDGTISVPSRTHATFQEYLSDLCRHSATSCPIKSLRRRAKRLLKEHEHQA